jgi:membrane dipeptidase
MTSPDWREVHTRAFVADAHNDLLAAVAARPAAQWVDHFRERWLPQLRAGGVDLQVLPVWVDATQQPESGLRTLLRMIEAAHQIAAGCPEDVALCVDADELRAARATGRIALVLAIEGCAPLDRHVELLSTMHRLGVRIASLAHFGRTQLADGSAEDDTGSRLTRAGVAAVELMNDIGMLVDVSHLGATGLAHVLELSRRPIIATHSSARAQYDHHRNLTDAQIASIAAGGGLICVNFFAGFIDPARPTPQRLVDHVAHIVAVAGIDHVGIGSDFVLEVEHDIRPGWCQGLDSEGLDTRTCIPGLEGPAGLPVVTRALLEKFSPDAVLQILGGNLMRLLELEFARAPVASTAR